MKTLIILILAAVCSGGCANIEYTNGMETLKVTTSWKSLDGLWADRSGEEFSLVIDKTYTHDPLRAIGELMESYQQMYDMGLRFDPAPREIP